MKLAWAGLVSLGLLIAVPAVVEGQDSSAASQVQLHRNYPNPFNPETTIPFSLDYSLWETGERPVVSLRIYNILAQLVAVPILQGSGEPLDNMQLGWNGTGEYAAYWDGKVVGSGREAASGVYVYQLVVNGQAQSKRMTIVK
ncbi:MAG: hypothetical protein PVH40_07410 [Gemmatimonadales bacterium]|jgi:hypothetical protein